MRFFLFFLLWFSTRETCGLNNECHPIYRRFSLSHTACKPVNLSCKIIKAGISDEDKELILREHNKYRSRIASGKEQKFPASANMMEIEWDDELAIVAQKHASLCDFEHDCSGCRQVDNFAVGQNLFDRKSTWTNPRPAWAAAIASFFEEISFAPKAILDNFIPGKYGHFSQVVWAKTWKIGCGYTAFKSSGKFKTEELYTCDYGPSGNTIENKMYQKGKPASDCPLNTEKSSNYTGLCKSLDSSGPKPEDISRHINGTILFDCDFSYEDNCGLKVEPSNFTETRTIYLGNYLSTVLMENESVLITFPESYQSDDGFCIEMTQRKGANEAEQPEDNILEIIMNVPEISWSTSVEFGLNWSDWVKANMQVSWEYETKLSLKFEVPSNASQQYLEIIKLVIYSGKCYNTV